MPLTTLIYGFLLTLGISLVLTPLVRASSTKFGLVSRPRTDRWHTQTVALLGGIAIFVSFMTGLVVFVDITREVWGLILGGMIIFIVGILDDLIGLRPVTKLVGQILAASVQIVFGIHAVFILHPLVSIPLTIFWIVGITNAFNLLDNMDGLSSGVALICSLFLLFISVELGRPMAAVLSVLMAGSALGFLVFNFNPAKIFMGDCGSLFLGFNLASLTLIGTWVQASNLFVILIVPVLVLAVPIFDTVLVTLLRKFNRRKVSQGGKDHSSHRLVALGLSERNAVLVLYGICTLFGLMGYLGVVFDIFIITVIGILLVVVIFFFGVFLGEVKIYRKIPVAPPGSQKEMKSHPQVTIISTILMYKRRIFEVLIDLVLICVSYFASWLFIFEKGLHPDHLTIIFNSLPIILGVKLAIFQLFGIYSGVWRYISISDAMRIGKAILASSVLTVLAILAITRFENFPRSLFVLDSILLFILAVGARLLLRIFREWFVSYNAQGRRLLIIGAGDAGEMILRELKNNSAMPYRPIGLIDDEPLKKGIQVHGIPVLGNTSDLKRLCAENSIEEILIAIPSATGKEMQRIVSLCEKVKIPFRTTPALSELIEGKVDFDAVRDVRVDDLIFHEPLRVDETLLRNSIQDRTIMLTGAGGLIGRELARRISSYHPRKLILCDYNENALSEIAREVGRGNGKDTIFPILGDIGDKGHIKHLLAIHPPETIIHAAGYNRGPLHEENVVTVVKNNVNALHTILEAGIEAGVASIILLSIEKAAEPKSVFALSKRLAELTALSQVGKGSRIAIFRISSLLSLDGGILSALKSQIERGGPVILPPEPAFISPITARDAANGILMTSALDVDGKIAGINTGDPVDIAEFAEKLILLSGRQVATVSRKVHSWDSNWGENQCGAPGKCEILYDRIYLWPDESLSEEDFTDIINRLQEATKAYDIKAVLEILHEALRI